MVALIDRYVARRCLAALLLVIGLVITLVIAMDVIMRLQLFLGAEQEGQLALAVRFYLFSLPTMISPLLPVAMTMAVVITCAPMLKRGELIALTASGVSLRRVTRSMMVIALLVGLLDVVLTDQLAPRLEARRQAIEDQLGGQVRNARIWQIEATGAWWYANQVILQDGELPQIKNVVVAPGAGLIHADALTWENEGWYLEGPITRWTVDGERRDQWQRHDRLPCSGDLALPLSVQQLTQRLVSRHALSGGELLQRGGQLNLALLSDRYGRLLVPLAMVLMVLPLFAQFAHRDQLLVSAARAVILSLLPLLIVATAGMTADSAVMHPFIIMSIALLLALAPGLMLYTRWRL